MKHKLNMFRQTTLVILYKRKGLFICWITMLNEEYVSHTFYIQIIVYELFKSIVASLKTIFWYISLKWILVILFTDLITD